jgi:peroxiredoxin
VLKTIFWPLAFLTLTIAAVGIWSARQEEGVPPTSRSGPQPVVASKHYVTPAQLTATATVVATPVPAFSATAHDGRVYRWPDSAGDRPLVIVFIKEGCPCNVEFEPYFHRLARAYAGSVGFVGVIDADVPAACRYAEANHVPYPVLADPARRTISRCRAANGAYVALIVPPGTVDSLWPGCSAEMLRELGCRIATVGGVAERPIDVADLPGALVTGCPFEW